MNFTLKIGRSPWYIIFPMLYFLFQNLRPRQWTKNFVLFAGLLFSEKKLLLVPWAWVYVLSGFAIFCVLSGCVYLLNDLVDVERDRLHPVKSQRPIASGKLPLHHAKVALVVLLTLAIGSSFLLPFLFTASALLYFFLNLAYSFKLKNVVILDVLSIAICFVLRAQAGVGAVQGIEPQVYISHWLILCTLMLALFLALAKRRQEIVQLRQDAVHHRNILKEYSLHFIDEMTALVTGSTVICYALYTVNTETIQKFGTDKLVYTVPFVLYGIFRYLYLIHIKQLGDNPSEILLSDFPIKINIVMWIFAVMLIIHWK